MAVIGIDAAMGIIPGFSLPMERIEHTANSKNRFSEKKSKKFLLPYRQTWKTWYIIECTEGKAKINIEQESRARPPKAKPYGTHSHRMIREESSCAWRHKP